jgi:hypothetical protein
VVVRLVLFPVSLGINAGRKVKIRELVNPEKENGFYLVEMKDGSVQRISRKGAAQFFKGPVPKVRTVFLKESHLTLEQGRD